MDKLKYISEEYYQKVKDLINKYSEYKYLVVATRPETEHYSLKKTVKETLELNGYKVNSVEVKKNNEEKYYEDKGKNIYLLLKN